MLRLVSWRNDFGLCCAALLAAAAIAGGASAATITWNNPADGTWSTAGYWLPTTVPGPGDDVVINLAGTYTISISGTPVSIKSLTLGGASGTQTVDIVSAYSLTLGANPSVINANGVINIGGGTLTVSGADLTVNGKLKLNSGGTLTGTKKTLIASGGTLEIASSSPTTINNHTIENSGLIACIGTGSISLNNSTTLTNLSVGTIDLQNDQAFGSTGGATVNNAGMFRKNIGSGTSSLASAITFTNTGKIEVMAPAATLYIHNLTNYNSGTATITGGVYLLKGKLQIGDGSTDVISTNATEISLDGAAAQIVNSLGSNMLPSLTTNTGKFSLVNGRNLALSGGLGNSGDVLVGLTCTLTATGYTQTAGNLGLPGGTLNPGAGGANINGGVLHGGGTITGNLNNNATVDMGPAPSNLMVNGNYTQGSAGALNLRLNGIAAGLFDHLDVTGSASLSGTLNLTCGYTAADNDTFAVLSFGTKSGDFATVTPVLVGGFTVERVWQANALQLRLHASGPLTITGIAASKNVEKITSPITFTATVTDPGVGTLAYTWDFADGTAVVTGNPATHAFATEGSFNGTLTVTDGFKTATANFTVSIVAPASGGSGTGNIALTVPNANKVANPLDGLTIEVISADGGVIELYIDVNALIREAYSVSTDFNGLSGRVTRVDGSRPVAKLSSSGIYVAESAATETATGTRKGKARKTIVISRREVGEATSLTDNRSSAEIKMKKMKGKFSFSGQSALTAAMPATARADSVAFSGTIQLPAGLNITEQQDLWIAIGNIVDRITLGPKAKPVYPSDKGYLKRVKVKYPKLADSITTGDETAQLDFTLSMPGMSEAGFDTEGVSAAVSGADKTPIERKIQVGVLLAGMSYQGSAPALFRTKVDKATNTPTSGELSGMTRSGR
jgi:hypothetical protein